MDKVSKLVKSRYAACVSYCRLDLVVRRLQELLKGGVIRFYALIEHDKDLNSDGSIRGRHIHIVLNFTSPFRETGVRNLFDSVDGEQNTLAQLFTYDYLSNRLRYLLHLDNKDKYQYNVEDIVTSDCQKFSSCIRSFIPSPHEDLMQLLQDILTMNLYQLASVYGRDVVINYHRYREYAERAAGIYKENDFES